MLSTPFQERVSYFTVYMLLLQNATVITHNVRINVLQACGLPKPKQLKMDKSILNSVWFSTSSMISTCFSYKITYKHIRANRHTNTNEAFRAEAGKSQICREVCQSRAGSNKAVRYIERDLLRDTLGKDGCLRDVELQAGIFFENGLKLRQDLKGYR